MSLSLRFLAPNYFILTSRGEDPKEARVLEAKQLLGSRASILTVQKQVCRADKSVCAHGGIIGHAGATCWRPSQGILLRL